MIAVNLLYNSIPDPLPVPDSLYSVQLHPVTMTASQLFKYMYTGFNVPDLIT